MLESAKSDYPVAQTPTSAQGRSVISVISVNFALLSISVTPEVSAVARCVATTDGVWLPGQVSCSAAAGQTAPSAHR